MISTPAAKSARRREASLRWRMLLWALALSIVPMTLTGVWLNRLAHEALVDRHAITAHNLAQTGAGAMATRIGHGEDGGAAAHTVATLLGLDPRVAFVLVYDQQGQPLAQHIASRAAWNRYRLTLALPRNAEVKAGDHRSCELGQGTIAVQYVDFPVDARAADGSPPAEEAGAVHGRVVLSLHDPSLAAAVHRLHMTQLAALAIMLLITLPAIFIGIQQWTGPLRRLVAATRDLAAHRHPEPVPVTTRDEVGQLAEQFNAMVRTLAETHRQLEQANVQLEQKVQTRTAELHAVNERLAEEIRDKNEFLRAVSHDLNAPVRNILGLAGMLLRKYGHHLDADARTKLERIRCNAHTQTSMIDELLELSRIRTRPGRAEPVDLNHLIHELTASLAYDLERARVTLNVASPLPTLHVAPNRVRQVFQNLLENAIKYMLDAPERRVTVSCQAEAEGVAFCVSDTGSGIEAADLERVFRPFQRGRQWEADRVAGRGVGLASVKSIVESWGGRMWIRSEPGVGSSFHFTVPYVHVDAPTPSEALAS